MHAPTYCIGVNYILHDGTKSLLPYNDEPEPVFSEVSLEGDTQDVADEVRRVVVYGDVNDGAFYGVQFWGDDDDVCLLDAGYGYQDTYSRVEFTLE